MPNYTQQEKIVVRGLWMQGHTASHIAKQMGRTRYAIIGLVNRLGLLRQVRPDNPLPLSGRKMVGRRATRESVVPKRSKSNVISLTRPLTPSEASGRGFRQDGKLLDIMELNSETCRWPIGNGAIVYCGATVDDGGPYCLPHRHIAYHPSRWGG